MSTNLRLALRDGTSSRFGTAISARSADLAAHSTRMTTLCAILGRAHGMDSGEVSLFCETAPFHDFGKIAIPAEILDQRRPLSTEEFELLKLHTKIGAQMLLGSESTPCRTASLIALTHHERWDGSGYPYGLAGEAIPEFSRLVSLVDQYDALRSSRPYKPAFSHDETCAILLAGDGRTRPDHFQPGVLSAFEVVQRDFERAFDEFQEAC